MMDNGRMPTVEHKTTILRGGLDLVTPSLSLADGYCTYAVNFECSVSGGYTRIKGYERADGRPSPSAALYKVVQVAGFINTPSLGVVVTQTTSGATGVVAQVGANYLILTKITGTFDSTHGLTTVGPVTVGTAVTITVILTAQQKAQALNASADIYRADITAVGGAAGTGSVLGVFVYNDALYAFRALTATPTTQGLWKSTTGGWSLITFPSEVSYTTSVGTGTGGATPPAEGATLTQGGVTATVRRVMEQTGAWRTAATAAADTGRFIITNVAGGNFAAGAATLTGGATVVLTGAQTVITMAVTTSGVTAKHENQQGNFFGQRGTIRTYGCDGANRGYEFDGTYLVPIATGASPDTPKHLSVHKNYLFFSINSSLFYSEVGQPYRWVTGGEIAVGDTISGLVQQPGSQGTGALSVFCRGIVFVLYGTDAAVFNLTPYNVGIGSIDYTQQNGGKTFYFSSEGVTSLQTTLDYGNFLAATLTARILPFIVQERTLVSCSTLMRLKNQYRIFFTDGYGLFITMVNGKPQGCMPVYFPNVPNVTWECELTNGDSVSYFGATDGFVYQLEKGTSFDGANIDAMLIMNWDVLKTPRFKKAFKHATMELLSPVYAAIQFSYVLGYGTPEIDMSNAYNLVTENQGFGLWDSGAIWDDLHWDGQNLQPSEVDMTGSAESVQIAILATNDYIDSFTINSLIYSYTMRRALR